MGFSQIVKKKRKMGKSEKCTIFFLVFMFLVVGAAFGISCYLFSQVNDTQNILAMVPICFTAFALLSVFVGCCGAKWSKKMVNGALSILFLYLFSRFRSCLYHIWNL